MKKNKNERMKFLLGRLSQHEDVVLSNNNNNRTRKIKEFQQDFHAYFEKSNYILIQKKNIAEEIAHDTEKNRENAHDVTLEHGKGSSKDHLTRTTTLSRATTPQIRKTTSKMWLFRQHDKA